MNINEIGSWEDVPWNRIEANVFRMQRRVFELSLEGNRTKMQRLQLKLSSCAEGRLLAVRKAAQESRGKNTPGIDGMRSLTSRQKLALAQGLRLKKRVQPVRRQSIPKPGTSEQRHLGIPTIADRALQSLIVLALEPEWEARFSEHQYGYRKGRNCHDAMANIRGFIQRSPCWVLDADIEKFFDHVDHRELLRKLQTHPRFERAIRNILNSGVLIGTQLIPTELGTPQGGPISPLLANIVLAGLEMDLTERFRKGKPLEDMVIAKTPRIVVYADDFVVLHPDRRVVEASRRFVEDWLKPFGLRLHPRKTEIRHTLEKVEGDHGFDFLGFRVQQFRTGKYALKPYFNRVLTLIKPSKGSIRRVYAKIALIIEETRMSKKRRPHHEQRAQAGQALPPEIMIHRINRVLSGWLNYYCHANSKRTFSGLDNKVFRKLWRWARRNYPKDRCDQTIRKFFNGGDPWIFSVKRAQGTVVRLNRADAKPIQRHIPVQAWRSYFDGDRLYWATRLGQYPGVPDRTARILKRQRGKCARCGVKLSNEDQWSTVAAVEQGGQAIMCARCIPTNRQAVPRG